MHLGSTGDILQELLSDDSQFSGTFPISGDSGDWEPVHSCLLGTGLRAAEGPGPRLTT